MRFVAKAIVSEGTNRNFLIETRWYNF